jgi:hypothetical protein
MKSDATTSFSVTPLLPMFGVPSQRQAILARQRGERDGMQTLETASTVASQTSGLDVLMAILREATAIIDNCDDECIHLQCGSRERTTCVAMMPSTSCPPKD